MISVADQLGIHVATVSRAVSEKWIQTPRGVFPLRRFFSGGTQSAEGEDMSWDAVKEKLKAIIGNEDTNNPLNDDEIVEKLKTYKYRDDVVLLGYVSDEQLARITGGAYALVYPSFFEGFGLPVLEAMASGTPVVANDVSSIPEVAGDAAFLVGEGNARAMGGAIIAILLQQPFRESMINQGLARATNFSWRKTAKETLAVYEKVMTM